MSSMFRNTDIVPSDFIAGFVLLRVKQKRESREQRRLALLAEQRYNCTSSKLKIKSHKCNNSNNLMYFFQL